MKFLTETEIDALPIGSVIRVNALPTHHWQKTVEGWQGGICFNDQHSIHWYARDEVISSANICAWNVLLLSPLEVLALET